MNPLLKKNKFIVTVLFLMYETLKQNELSNRVVKLIKIQ